MIAKSISSTDVTDAPARKVGRLSSLERTAISERRLRGDEPFSKSATMNYLVFAIRIILWIFIRNTYIIVYKNTQYGEFFIYNYEFSERRLAVSCLNGRCHLFAVAKGIVAVDF